MIRFSIGLLIIMGVAGDDCNGKCDPSMEVTQMLIWAAIGLGLMIWSLPKMMRG
jgi:hypothetical protein